MDHRIVILSHDRDYSKFGLHETALFRFSRLFTRLKKDLLKKQIESNNKEVLYLHKREFEHISFAFASNSYFYTHN